jgi:hypothetical protein
MLKPFHGPEPEKLRNGEGGGMAVPFAFDRDLAKFCFWAFVSRPERLEPRCSLPPVQFMLHDRCEMWREDVKRQRMVSAFGCDVISYSRK